jgi:virulence factor mviN homolog
MGGLVWYNCPSIQEWAAMTFLMRIYWLVWLIGLAAVVYLGVLVLLGVRKHHLLTKH